MLRFYDATGKGHLGQATIKRSTGINGSISLSGTIFDGQEVIQGLDYGWRLFFDDQYFAVTYRKLNDQDKTVEFDAIQQFFWDFSKTSLYTQSSGSHTFEWYLGQLFQDSGYTYDVQGTVLALEKDNWGMKNKLDLFNDIIKQADVEFEVSNKNIIIRQQIGSDLTGIVRQGINLANLIEETDISNFATYIKGYGKFVDENDHSKGRLEAEYTSPLAQVYGKLEMDPYVNESFSVASSFKSELKNKVDATYSVSLKLDIYDLENAGYPSVASPQVGDWIMAIDESLNFQKRIRIIKVDEEFDSVGKRIGYTATCGDLSSADSYQSSLGQLADKVEQVQNDVSLIVQTAANGYNRIYRGKDDPRTLQFKDLITGDSYYQTNGDQVTFWQWDGTRWVKVVDDMTGKEVSDKVDTAMQEMAEKEAELNQHTIDISQIKTDITQAENDIEQARQDASADLASFQVTVNADIDEAKQQATDAYTTATSIDAKAQQALNSATEAVTNTVNLQTTVDDLNGEMSSKADQETVDTLDKTVKNQSTLINQNAEELKSKADSSVVDEINKTVSVNSIEIEQNAKAIEGKANSVDLNKISGDLTTLTNNFNVTSSGFSADISAVKTRLGDAESGLETAKVDIKATANDLKVNYTKTTDEHDYVNSQIKQSADKLEASVASVSDVANAEDTNLIFNGSFKNGDNWKLGSLNTYFGVGARVPISAGTYINFSSPTDVNTVLAFIQNPNADVLRSITGNTVTMSIYARCQKNGGQIRVYIRTEDADGNYSYFNSGKAYDLTTAWTRYSMTAKLPTGIKAINLSFQFINIAANVVCYATGAMLNMGNVLLPYSESTLDSDAKIAKLEIDADGIKQTVSNKADTSYVDQKANSLTTTIGRNKTDADNKINANKKDVDNQISQVKQTANSLSSTVANNKTATDKVINANKQSADTQFSNINQTINGVKITVNGKADISQVSQLSNQINLVVKNNNTEHTNLLLNGSFRNGDNWHYSAKVTDEWYGVSSNSPIDNGTYGGFHADDGNAAPSQVWDTNYAAKVKGKQVTFSAYARATNAGKFRPYIRTEASDGTYSYFGTGSTNYDVSTGWKRYSVTATLPKDIKEMMLNLQFGTTKTGEKYYFTGAMLTLGGQLWPYQDSTKDIVSQINIDESGVLIQGKKIMIDGDATIKNAVIKSSMIDTLDASKITAGTLNAANVNIINLNVSKLVGDKTNFVQSAWNGVSQSVMISPAGLLSLGLSGFVSLTETGMNTFANVGDNYELVGNFQSATVAGTNSTNGSLVSIEPSGDFIGFGQRTSVKDPYSMVFTYWRNAGAGYKKGLNSTEDIYINSAKTLYAKKWGTIDAAKNAYVELGATSINKAGNYPVLGNQGLSSGFAFQGSHVWMLSGTKDLYDMTGTIKGFSGIQGKTILLPTEIPGSGQYAGLVKSYISIKLA